MSLYAPASDPTFYIGDGPREPNPEMMETGRIPVHVYTSAERFEREKEMFGRSWLYVGRVEEIPSSGDWFTKTIDILSVSAIIARGKDGEIRAFPNICSHRGRSEEHTSELQSLMRISSAVFSLKKKNSEINNSIKHTST